MSVKRLKIGSLLLDQHNPRTSETSNQRDALQHILDDQQEKLANLAEDIVELGMNPTDNLLVVRSPTSSEKFIVLEGNRRAAALKILKNPHVLSGLSVSNGLKRRFEKAAAQFKLNEVESVPCFAVGSREDANIWIQRRHTGEDEGRGIVNWNAQAAGRFRGGNPALQALEFVRTHGGLSGEQQALLQGRFISTLLRLVESPDIRAQLGLDLVKDRLHSTVPAEEVIKGLRRIVLDLSEKKITVTQLKKKQQMLDYIAGLDKKDLPDLSKSIPPTPLDELGTSAKTSSNPTSSPGAPSPTRPRPAPPRVSVVPRTCRLHVTNPKALEIFEELRTLKLKRYPHAIAVLLRVFLEISVDHHLVAIKAGLTYKDPKSGRQLEKSLHSKITEVVAHFVANGASAKDFTGVNRAMSATNQPLSPQLLHSYVHNSFVTPTERDLTAAWDNAQPVLERIWK